MFDLFENFGEQIYETILVETIPWKQPSRIQRHAYFKVKEDNLKRARLDLIETFQSPTAEIGKAP